MSNFNFTQILFQHVNLTSNNNNNNNNNNLVFKESKADKYFHCVLLQ